MNKPEFAKARHKLRQACHPGFSPLANYAGCTNEVALNSCTGANRNIYEATLGYWYRLYRGEFGRIEQGNQVVYIHRNLWSGIGRAPQGGDLVAYTTLRFYLP